LELQSRIVLAAGKTQPVSIFDGAIEGFGADISKLHKQIMEERDELKLSILTLSRPDVFKCVVYIDAVIFREDSASA
jgi:hypothetical protein